MCLFFIKRRENLRVIPSIQAVIQELRRENAALNAQRGASR